MTRFWAVCTLAMACWTYPSFTAGVQPEVESEPVVTSTVSSEVEFNRDVRPILSEYCLACHGFDANHREAGLRLDTREGAIEELSSGLFAVTPGSPEESELMERLLSDDEDLRMPPHHTGKTLTSHQIQILKKWIEQDAPYDPHWAFESPNKPDVPTHDKSRSQHASTSASDAESHNPIDAFIDESLMRLGFEASPRAMPSTLLRRLSLDLIGLPPTLQEMEHFESEYALKGHAAYVEQVEALLQSPHYGEKWGRWWLDQARYSDSNGYSIDSPRSIWLYRDWVINAFNEDMPFAQFTIEQLAGDLLPDPTESQLIATGFHRNTQINEEGGIDPEQFRIESIFDRVATTSTVFLGLTVGCAQCHDHKFDPISQKEFYQLFAFFNNQDEPNIRVYPDGVDAKALEAEKAQWVAKLASLSESLQDSIRDWNANLSPEERAKLAKATIDALNREPPRRSPSQQTNLIATRFGDSDEKTSQAKDMLRAIQRVDRELGRGVSTMILRERATPRQTHVYIQGDFTRPDEEVFPGTLAILHPLNEPGLSQNSETGRLPNRLDLARWIVAPENPLTSRVIVNRVWQSYFGRGLVETENDFGLQSSVPTHPELLDWLATGWIENGMQFKDLHRQIVTSETYMRSSFARSDLLEVDRENYYLAKQNRIRLDAELVRDAGLTASGLLSRKVGGPSVFPPIPDGVMNQGQVARAWNVSQGEDRYRRGLYTFTYRATPPPSLNVFDAPEGNSTCTQRNRSNTPLQALTLLNDSAQFEFANSLSTIIESDGIEKAFQRCTSRLPTDEEMKVLNDLPPISAARVLLNLDETITRE